MCDDCDDKKKQVWTLAYINECILEYCKDNNGKWPHHYLKIPIKNDGRQWGAINSWLIRNYKIYLSDQCIYLGNTKNKKLSLEYIDECILKYVKDNDKWPTIRGIIKNDGRTWAAANEWLKTFFKISLNKRCIYLGKKQNKEWSLEYAIQLIIEYNIKTKRWPFRNGKIIKFDGRTWGGLDNWLIKCKNTNLKEICESLGKNKSFTEGYINKKIIEFKKQTNHWPYSDSIKISNDNRNWAAIDFWLKKYKQISLSEKCNELGKDKEITKNKNGIGENLSRKFINQLTGKIFIKIRPKWLINFKTNKKLELDGYCEELMSAFEYNGEQHYEYTPEFHRNGISDFEKQKQRDKLKIKLCKQNNIKLIVIPYWIKNLEEFILSELKRLEIPIIQP